MARKLSTKTNVEAPSSAFPYGRIKDDTGANDGTPVNEQVYGDFHQFFERLMATVSIAFNGLPDSTSNGYQYMDALQKHIAAGAPTNAGGVWTSANVIMYSVNSGETITITAGNLLYSKYKINGKTFIWQIKIEGATVAGSPSGFLMVRPASVLMSNNSFRMTGGFLNGNIPIRVQQIPDPNTSIPVFSITKVDGTAWANGTTSLDIQIMGEIL